jgi:hypothetical protein
MLCAIVSLGLLIFFAGGFVGATLARREYEAEHQTKK